MRPSLVSSSLVLLTSFASTATALKSLVNSPCAVQCGNVQGSTTGNDIVCPDTSYSGYLAGTTFTSCITCQLGSTYVDPATNQTDLQWALYNLRYAISWCLFGYPNNTAVGDSPCITSTACGPLQDAIEYNSLSPNVTEYSYCSIMLGNIFVPKCNACLTQQSNEFYLTNFLTALNAACIQQPRAGNTISIQGSLFSTTAVNITTPSAAPGKFHPSTGLTLSAKIGIAVGGIVLVLLLLGFCIIWNGKRRRRAVLKRVQQQSGHDDWRRHHDFTPENDLRGGPFAAPLPRGTTPPMSAGPAFFDSPDSQRPLNPQWSARPLDDDSPATAFGEKAYFSPYTSQYSSPVSATDAILVGNDWPIDRKVSGGGNMPGRVRSRSRDKKERVGDQFEMQNVTPVLLHPGHGRTVSIPLTEEDAKRGAAM